MTTRVRFAPSPTGVLHLGSARTALYNWLAARAAGEDGTYVLRIEDTDRERSTPEHVQQALAVFRWMGLEWDEGPNVGGEYGPYYQSERGDDYATYAQQLLDSGRVYECYCTADELAAEREAAQAEKRSPVYSGRCRNLTDDERASMRADGRQVSLRFAVPETGDAVVTDLIHGETRFENALLGDFIIVRSSVRLSITSRMSSTMAS